MSEKKFTDPTTVGAANGVTRGDEREIPSRGTSAGVLDVGGGSYGADIGAGATNRQGGIGRSTRSDPKFATNPPGGGDRRAGSGMATPGGSGMGSAAHSDGAMETSPDKPA